MPSSQVEQIKERLGIADVIGTYVKLEKAGANFKARCPFHNEKTPSFFITPARNTYYCFGCGAKGDIFSFVQEFEGVDFMGALKVLAERAGVELKRERPEARSERERLFSCVESATIFYQKNLYTKTENATAVDYLLARGLTKETIKEWRIGFAENDWRRLLHYLTHERKFNLNEIEKTGLIIRKENIRNSVGARYAGIDKSISADNYYDRFRGRIMFPLFDSSGRVIGFSGRIFGVSPEEEKTSAKYLNGPETELFHKSEVLYGFHEAKSAIRERGFSILVEGQMDMLMSQQAGWKNTVAVSGTALTLQHLGRLQRLSEKVIMAFDPDSAGVKAANRSAQMALSLGMDVRIAALPKGEDPALFILNHRDQPEKWQAILDNATHIVNFTLNRLLALKLDEHAMAREVTAQLLPLIAQVPDTVQKAYFVSLIPGRPGHKEAYIWEELKKIEKKMTLESVDSSVPSMSQNFPGNGRTQNAESTRKNMIAEKIIGILFWHEGKTHKSETLLDTKLIRERLKKLLAMTGEESAETIFKAADQKKDELILEAEISHDQSDYLQKNLEELFINLEEDQLKEQFASAISALNLAEKVKDGARAKEMLQLCKNISDRLSSLRQT
jgi:DNA primase